MCGNVSFASFLEKADHLFALITCTDFTPMHIYSVVLAGILVSHIVIYMFLSGRYAVVALEVHCRLPFCSCILPTCCTILTRVMVQSPLAADIRRLLACWAYMLYERGWSHGMSVQKAMMKSHSRHMTQKLLHRYPDDSWAVCCLCSSYQSFTHVLVSLRIPGLWPLPWVNARSLFWDGCK